MMTSSAVISTTLWTTVHPQAHQCGRKILFQKSATDVTHASLSPAPPDRIQLTMPAAGPVERAIGVNERGVEHRHADIVLVSSMPTSVQPKIRQSAPRRTSASATST